MVAGNVRRSAEIALGEISDPVYLWTSRITTSIPTVRVLVG